ncbi:chymotrypsin-2 isoform X2 [Penaeus vannamei]|uniref:chymotrypsin-2 isoform X2 n=1 Tax=Penaeus vannamei TaxID=6689 RepID=UPI00387F6496
MPTTPSSPFVLPMQRSPCVIRSSMYFQTAVHKPHSCTSFCALNMNATTVFLFAALCVSAVAEVPLWELTPIPPVEVSGEGPPPPESSEGPPLSDQRIVGGNEAEPYKRGYQAALTSGKGFCGGVVISKLFVLTAAHCIPGNRNEQMNVTVGIHDLKVKEKFTQRIPVAKAFVHPDYYSGRQGPINDIAVLKLEQEIKMTDKVFPLKLPTHPVKADTPVVVTGWGRTMSEDNKRLTTLQEIVTRIMTAQRCKQQVPFAGESIFCTHATNVSPCNGDSGGPAMHEGYLVGLVSFGARGCTTNIPQGFTSVYYHLKWIERAMHPNYTDLNGCGILDLSLVLIVLAQLFLYRI